MAYKVKAVVDATGDCDIAKFANAPTDTFKQGNVLAAWYYSYCKKNGYNYLSIEGQIAYLLHELKSSSYGYIYDYNQLVQENEALRAQLAQAQEEARSAAEANEENERLRALLGYLEKHTSYITESAQITAWDPSNWVRAFTISKGSNQGIEKGDCVITEDGSLVGQVAELGPGWATVRTVIDVNMDVGVLVGDGEIAAVVVGDYALMQEGLCKLTYFTEDVTLFVGDRVVTSGNGGAFPPNIALGTVTELRSEAGGQSYYAVVKPDVNIGMLSQIFIIKDFEVIE